MLSETQKAEYSFGSYKLGPKRFMGLVNRIRLVEVHPGFTKMERKTIAKVFDRGGFPFLSDDTARKYAKAAMIKLIKDGEVI
ncbi:MAG: hypothetical protein MN733_03405 [Nitrososphaera sp.]|nr:hypothetical protein [Nitrososphaera sp.]